MDHTVWRYQARYLAHHGHSVMALDLPGHGRDDSTPLSTIEDAADWVGKEMAAAGIGAAAVVGHSMGALVALELAADQGEMVEALVLVGVNGEMPVHPDLQVAADHSDPLAVDLIISWSYGQPGRLGGHPQPGTREIATCRRLLERGLRRNLGVDLSACSAYRGSEAASRVRCPTLVIAGRLDRMTPLAGARKLAAAIPGARVEVVEGAGHMVMTEAPDRVRRLVATFLSH
jgi:pimeloyl-ACP methyl ester carboxylesterase